MPSEHQKLRKKIRKFSLKTAEAKKKNKKKTGSNDEKLRKLEPQQKQRVLIKKRVYHAQNAKKSGDKVALYVINSRNHVL